MWCDEAIGLVEKRSSAEHDRLAAVLLQRAELCVRAGDLQRAVDDATRAAVLARDNGNAVRMGRAVVLMQTATAGFFPSREGDGLVELCNAALQLLAASPDPIRIHVMAALALELAQRGDIDGYRVTATNAWRLARPRRRRRNRIRRCRLRRVPARQRHGTRGGGRLRAAVAAADRTHDGDQLMVALGFLCTHTLAAGNVTEYRRVRLDHAGSPTHCVHVRNSGQRQSWKPVHCSSTADCQTRSRPSSARDSLPPTPSAPYVLFNYGTQLASLRIEQGRAAEVENLLRMATAQYPGYGAWRAALAYCLREKGDIEGAHHEYEAVVAPWRDTTPSIPGLSLAVALLVDMAAALDDARDVDLFANCSARDKRRTSCSVSPSIPGDRSSGRSGSSRRSAGDGPTLNIT